MEATCMLMMALALVGCVLLPPACAQEGRPEREVAPPAASDGVLGPKDQGRELIGRPAPSLDGVRWLDGKPHPLAEDRGKVVLLRWWTVGCPFCRNTAPALRALAKEHGADLVIRAIYHPKPAPAEVSDEEVKAAAERLGLDGFTVGVDADWSALDRWWLGDTKRSYTSVSFLVDPRGRIHRVHSGSEFHARDHLDEGACKRKLEDCDREYQLLDAAIRELIRAGAASEPERPASSPPPRDA